MLRWHLIALLIMSLAGVGTPALADRLLMDDLRSDYRDGNMPRNGETMQQVERRFGSPEDRIPAVGDPPISRWIYGEFTVYFEHERVLHAVRRRE